MSIIKNTFTYTIGTLLAQFFGIFTSLATRKYLTPELMGIWSLMLLILNYLSFGHCGIFTAVEVRIPYLRGKGEEAEIVHIRNIAYSVSLALSFLVMFCLSVILVFFSHKLSVPLTEGLKWVVFIGIATIFYNLYISFLRADKNFNLISAVTIINAAVLLGFTVLLGLFYGLKGIYCATFIATLISFLFLAVSAGYKLNWSFKFKRAKELFLVGSPILAFGFVYTFFISLDKFLIIKMLGPKALGFYSIAILAFTYSITIPKLFSIVIFPSMQEVLGKTGSYEGLINFIKKPSFIMSYIFPPALALIYYFLPLVVVYFIPRYINGITSMQILLIGCFFISFAYLPQNIFISRNKQLELIPITILAMAVGFLLNFIAVKSGYGIEGVAVGSSVAYFIYFLISFFYSIKISGFKENKTNLFIKLCLPLISSIIIVFLAEHLIFISNLVFSALVKFSLYLVFYLLFLFYIDKKIMILPFIFSQIRKNKNAVDQAVLTEAINEA